MKATSLSLEVAMTKDKSGAQKKKPFFFKVKGEIFIPDDEHHHARPLVKYTDKNREPKVVIIFFQDHLIITTGKKTRKIKL